MQNTTRNTILTIIRACPLGDIAKSSLFSTTTEEAIPFIIKFTKSKSTSDADSAYRSLGNINSPCVQKILFNGLRHRSNTVRQTITDGIRSQANENWTQDIIQAITLLCHESRNKKKNNSELIIALRKILIKSANPTSIPELLDALKNECTDVRQSVIEALGATKDRSATKPLLDLMKDPMLGLWHEFRYHSICNELRLEILLALANIGDPDSIPDIIALPPTVTTATVLAKLQAPEAFSAIFKELENPRDPGVATTLTNALISIKHLDTSSELNKALHSENINIRQAAALALCETDMSSIAVLEDLLHEPGSNVVRIAEALINLGNPKGFPALVSAVADEDGMRRRCYPVAKVCEKIPGPESKELLLYILKNCSHLYTTEVHFAIIKQSKLSNSL